MIKCVVTAKLICTFVFAYVKRRFSHDSAHMFLFLCHTVLEVTMRGEINQKWLVFIITKTAKTALIMSAPHHEKYCLEVHGQGPIVPN